MVSARLYDFAWQNVRKNLKKHNPLSDERLWHKAYERYLDLLPPATLEAIRRLERQARRDLLVEAHLGILRPIAGRIAYKRAPHSFGIWSKESNRAPHVSLVHELAAFGVFGLLIAADRFEPEQGRAFSTYANYWCKKFIRLYLEELIGTVPRTGDMGDDGRRSVMDLVDAALDCRRLYRGKAAGGMALFDSGFTIAGPNDGDKEIEIVGSDGQTNSERLDYLQRHVGKKDYPWVDVGTYFHPRLELPGHAGGKASDEPAGRELVYELDDEPLSPPRKATLHKARDYRLGVEEVAGKRRLKLIPIYRTVLRKPPSADIVPAEICYLDKRCGSFNSYDNFGKHTYTPPKELIVPNVNHWRNSIPFAVEYLRRIKARLPAWRKPTYFEELRDARHDRKNGLFHAA